MPTNSTNFVSGTRITARWLNDVDRTIFEAIPNVANYGSVNATTLAEAVAANTGKVITISEVDDDTALPANYSGVAIEYTGRRVMRNTHVSTTSGIAKKALKAQFEASHSGTQRSGFHLEAQALGSGANGPGNADYGMSIAVHKSGYAGGSSPTAGELNGLAIYLRQDGPKGEASGSANSSDGAGILVNVQNVEDAGFLAAWEAASSNYNRGSGTIVQSIQTQIGVLDMNQTGTPAYGFVAVSTSGSNDHAFYAGEDGGTWTNILYAPNAVTIDSDGNYRAPNSFWPNGAWSVVRSAAQNGSTQITHRGTGALFIYAEDNSEVQVGVNGANRWRFNAAGGLTPHANLSGDLGSSTRRVSELWGTRIDLGSTSSNGVKIAHGSGSPEGVVTANVGSIYLRTNGSTGTSLYVKESGTGNTGWAAK